MEKAQLHKNKNLKYFCCSSFSAFNPIPLIDCSQLQWNTWSVWNKLCWTVWKKKDPGRPLFQSEQNHMFELEKLCWVFQILGANTLVVWRFWGQKSTISFRGLKSRCELGWFPLEALRKTPFLYLLELLEVAYVSWFVGPSSTFKQHPFNLILHHHIAFSSDSDSSFLS